MKNVNSSPMERLALRPEEAFEMLGISKAWGYRLLREGKIPSKRIDKRYIVPVNAVREMLESAAKD